MLPSTQVYRIRDHRRIFAGTLVVHQIVGNTVVACRRTSEQQSQTQERRNQHHTLESTNVTMPYHQCALYARRTQLFQRARYDFERTQRFRYHFWHAARHHGLAPTEHRAQPSVTMLFQKRTWRVLGSLGKSVLSSGHRTAPVLNGHGSEHGVGMLAKSSHRGTHVHPRRTEHPAKDCACRFSFRLDNLVFRCR